MKKVSKSGDGGGCVKVLMSLTKETECGGQKGLLSAHSLGLLGLVICALVRIDFIFKFAIGRWFAGQCWAGSCCTVWISCAYTCIHSIPSLPHTPIPPLQVSMQHWAESPVLHSSFPWALCLARGHVYVSMLLSESVPPSSSLAVPTDLSLHLCLHSCSTDRFLRTVFLEST